MNKKNNDGISLIKLTDSLNLKEDFPVPNFEEWKEKVVKDLKGKPYNKLITKTIEGIELQPIYTRLSKAKNTHPDEYPIAGGRRATTGCGYYSNDWLINQKIEIADSNEFNVALKYALSRGQNCINISFDKATLLGLDADYAKTEDVGKGGVSVSGVSSFSRALNGIDLTKYPLVFESGFNPINIIALLSAFCDISNLDIRKIRCYVDTDPIGFWASEGKLPVSLNKSFKQIATSINWAEINAPEMKILSVNTLPYINSGANSVQELAIMLATSAEYIRKLLDLGCDVNKIVKRLKITMGIGASFFNEVSKFRAAKILWRNLLNAFDIGKEFINMEIFAVSSEFNKTIFDPYVNMLRETTETFSAIVGGITGLQIAPFDSAFSLPDDFSRRIAGNTQLILKEESHFNVPIDPAGGSYFVEELTEELAKKAWSEFQEIERNGGIIESLKDGFIQTRINRIFQKRMEMISKRKKIIVGTNMYANPKEKMPKKRKINHSEIQKNRAEFLQKYRVSKSNFANLKILNLLSELKEDNANSVIDIAKSAFVNGATIGEITSACSAEGSFVESEVITPIVPRRAAELFEKLRLKSFEIKKKSGKFPSLFLATIGNLKEYKARADFSRNFFEVGGFEVVYPNGFENVDKAVKAALESKCKIVVLCSTDDKYEVVANEFAEKIKNSQNNLTIVMAGYPKEHIEEYKQNGIDEFIYLGADSFKIISGMLNKFIAEGK